MRSIFLLFFLLASTLCWAQKEESRYLFEIDSTWTREIFPFPIGFAQDIPYEGFEDAIFTPGWAKPESPQYWSYVIGWAIQAEKPLETTDLEVNMERYFNGLMRVAEQQKENEAVLPTTALFVNTETHGDETFFTGKIRVYDNFKGKQMMTLYFQVHQYFCPESKAGVLVFRCSIKPFEDAIWEELKAIPLRKDHCGVVD